MAIRFDWDFVTALSREERGLLVALAGDFPLFLLGTQQVRRQLRGRVGIAVS